MLIREWQEQDNQKICLLESECFSDPWSLQMIESAFSLPTFFGLVACENNEVIGYIGGQSLFEDGEIFLVAVDKDYRKKGYGKSLVLAFAEQLKQKGVERLLLEVRVSNLSAITCYKNCGFCKIAERKSYYSNGEDALIMEKIL